MHDVRHRTLQNNVEKKDEDKKPEATVKDDVISTGPQFIGKSDLPNSTNNKNAFDTALKDFTPRWRNYITRSIFALVMISSFSAIVYCGPFALTLLVLAIQVRCFQEVSAIGYNVYKVYNLPWLRLLCWYFVFTFNYFFFGEDYIVIFGSIFETSGILQVMITYHRFISFCLYLAGIIGFVYSLVKKHCFKQFTLFALTHMVLILLGIQSHMGILLIYTGIIWFLLPVALIICNDMMSYLFGFFFGRTPLIKLSPKKTWEGFIGGVFGTVLFGLLLSYVCVQFDYLICPTSYDVDHESLSMECERHPVFILTHYDLPPTIQWLLALCHIPWRSYCFCPFFVHALFISLFASIIAPFGGFFASGFKRAYKIKDFSDAIPGHGGVTDRFDCQWLMATFVYVYYHSFIKTPDRAKILQNIFTLRYDDQLHIFRTLNDTLLSKGLLGSSNP